MEGASPLQHPNAPSISVGLLGMKKLCSEILLMDSMAIILDTKSPSPEVVYGNGIYYLQSCGVRVFDVQVQDQKLPRFDIMHATNGSIFTKIALTSGKVPVVDNIAIQLKSIAGKGNPSINAIECIFKEYMSEDSSR